MDANKFMVEYKRMCASYEGCQDCSLRIDNRQCTEIPSHFTKEFTDNVIKIVEDWSAAHPRKTRQSVFITQNPEVFIYDGVISIKPCQMVQGYTSRYCTCDLSKCTQCRKEFWSQEVE